MNDEYMTAEPVPPVALPDKASGMAITALILGILSFCCCGMFTGIPALIVGFIENGRIKRGESSEKGKGMALAGIVLGIVSLAMTCLMVILQLAGVMGNVLQQIHP